MVYRGTVSPSDPECSFPEGPANSAHVLTTVGSSSNCFPKSDRYKRIHIQTQAEHTTISCLALRRSAITVFSNEIKDVTIENEQELLRFQTHRCYHIRTRMEATQQLWSHTLHGKRKPYLSVHTRQSREFLKVPWRSSLVRCHKVLQLLTQSHLPIAL